MKYFILFLFCLTNSCSFIIPDDCNHSTYIDSKYSSATYTNYKFDQDAETPDGIKVDTSGFDVDLNMIDQMTQEVTICLKLQSIDYCGFKVKIANDWKHYNCPDADQIFPCKLPNQSAGCETLECPCGCAGIVQYPATAIVTPNLKSYKHEMIHILTHIEDHNDLAFKCQ